MALDHTTQADDLATLTNSAASCRQSLRWLLAGAAAIPLAGCGAGDGDTSSTNSSSTSTGSTGTTTASSAIPAETGGPYPGDGANRNANGVANA